MNFLTIDGNSIMNRAFYGIKSLSNSFGQPTNAIYGFLNILLKLQKDLEPQFAAIAFDVKAPTFRNNLFDQYKANRHPSPNELISQLKLIKEILPLMGYKVIEKTGFEADDILGTLANLAKDNQNLNFTIVTGDRDSLQLINKNVNVKIMSTKFGNPITIDYDLTSINSLYNILPQEFIDVKALMGDKSDNIPGVTGIGEKTALSLISKYHNIDNIYNNIESLNEKDSIKNKLIASKEMAYLSKDLATICNCVPIKTEIDYYKIKPIKEKELIKILSELEIFSIIKRLGLYNEEPIDQLDKNHQSTDQITFKELSNLKSDAFINNDSIETIKQSLDSLKNKKIYLLFDIDNKFIIKLDDNIFYGSNKTDLLKLLLEKHNFKKNLEIYTHGAKKIHFKTLSQFGQTLNIKLDTELSAYLLNPDSSNYDIERLINIYCKKLVSKNVNELIFSFIDLCNIMEKEIEDNSLSFLLYDVEIPLSVVLADMEVTGFKLDQKGLIVYGETLAQQIEKLQNEIFDTAGCEFNINSPKQMSKVLFENLNLPQGKKTKTGFSTNAEVLEFLRDKHPIINKILEYRLLVKLKNTYVDGLLSVVQDDNRIHSEFKQTETKTGRISSQKPNMQNIPIKTDIGSQLRNFFIADDGKKLIDGDYSQIELRILADFSQDKHMIDAFINDEDIHAKTASQIFNVPLDMVTPHMRSIAKSVNFGIIYGISSFSLSKDIGVSLTQAKKFIDSYFKNFNQIKDYLTQTIENASKIGYVTTAFGRKRYIKELNSKNKNIRALGERIAKNTPIQGTAADIIKIAMVNVYKKLTENNMKSKLILQIHDELIIEAPSNEIDLAQKILKEEMQNAINLKVPLKIDIGIAQNWLDSH